MLRALECVCVWGVVQVVGEIPSEWPRCWWIVLPSLEPGCCQPSPD